MERYKTRLKEFRDAAGLTQQELAEITGVGLRTIATMEGAKGSNPSAGTLIRLMTYFKISFEELIPHKNLTE